MFQCARDCSHKTREASTRQGRVARGGHVPQEKFLISDLRSFLVPFWGETARVGRLTANLVTVFETFTRSHNLKAQLCFAPRHGKNCLASYWMYSFSCYSVELRDTNTVSSDPQLFVTMVSVGRSVRSYVCADLLSTREGSPSKRGCICIPLTLSWIRHRTWSSCLQTISALKYDQ